MDGGGETSPSGVLGEEKTIGNRASIIGRDIFDLWIERRGFFLPKRLVNSVKDMPLLPRVPSEASDSASAGRGTSGDDALERRSGSISARSPIEVFDRLRRIEAMRGGGVACRYRILELVAGAGHLQ